MGNTLATNIVIKSANGQQIKEKILTKSVANEGINQTKENRLLSDTKFRKDSSKNIFIRNMTCNFTEHIHSFAQILRHKIST